MNTVLSPKKKSTAKLHLTKVNPGSEIRLALIMVVLFTGWSIPKNSNKWQFQSAAVLLNTHLWSFISSCAHLITCGFIDLRGSTESGFLKSIPFSWNTTCLPMRGFASAAVFCSITKWNELISSASSMPAVLPRQRPRASAVIPQ